MPLTCFEHDGFDATRWAASQSLSASPSFQGKNRNWNENPDRSDVRRSVSLEACYPVVVFPSDRTWRLLVRHDTDRITSTSLRRARQATLIAPTLYRHST